MVGRPDLELCEISLKAALLWPSSSIMTCKMPSSAIGPLITGLIHGSLIAATDWIKRSSLLLKTVKKQTRWCLPQLHTCLVFCIHQLRGRGKVKASYTMILLLHESEEFSLVCGVHRSPVNSDSFFRFPKITLTGWISEVNPN